MFISDQIKTALLVTELLSDAHGKTMIGYGCDIKKYLERENQLLDFDDIYWKDKHHATYVCLCCSIVWLLSPPSSRLACTIWNCSFQSRLLKYQNWHKSVRILWFGVRLLGRPPWRGGCPSQLIDNSGTLGPNIPPALTPHVKSPQFVYLLFGNSLVVLNLCLSNIIHHYAIRALKSLITNQQLPKPEVGYQKYQNRSKTTHSA